MNLVRIALLAGAVLGAAGAPGRASPADAPPAVREAARLAMREAMMKQAAMPARPPVMPAMKPGGSAPMPERMAPPGKMKGDAAMHKATGSGMQDADAMRAEMANRAVMGGAMGTMKQTSGDMMNAPMMQRSQGMDPGGGMGPGGMGPGGMKPPATGGR